MKSILQFSFCTFVLSSCCFAQQDETPPTEPGQPVDPPAVEAEADEFQLAELPPLKRLVLYNSGVGQLQHAGQVDGKTRLQIRFSRHDVNDVLKSLVFEDLGGGNVRAVEYQPAPEPEDVAANQVGTPMTLAQLLQRFRGETVLVSVGGNEIRGTIYGVENRVQGAMTVETLVLLNADGFQSIELPSIDRARFEKQEIRNGIELAMAGVVKSRKANQKQLDLLLDGNGERDVQFAYVVDMPIWRMTYRLSMDEQQTVLQGWAHVDNVTGVDWEKVEMELRSGRPQAFHVNVFAPLMAERPDFGNSVFTFTKGLTLITQWFGFTPRSAESSGGGFGDSGGGFGGGGLGGGGGVFGGGGGRRSAGVDIASAFKAAATHTRASQSVMYKLDEPVDIGAGKSAALPVFAETLPAKRLSVYDDFDERPIVFRAIQLTNSTPYPLIAGPISVMWQGDFIGDGPIGRVNVGGESEVVYGLDRALQVERSTSDTDKELKSIEISKQQVVLQYLYRTEVEFKVSNKDTEERTLRLRYQLDVAEDAWKDIKILSPENVQAPDGIATFMLNIPPQSEETLKIVLGLDEERFVDVDDVYRTTIRVWNEAGIHFSAEDQQFMDEVLELQSSIDRAKSNIKALNDTKTSLVSEQSRVRNNLEAVSANSEAAKFYIDKLQELEISIQDTNEKTTQANTELKDLERQKRTKIAEYKRG